MERPADENLPEVVTHPTTPNQHTTATAFDTSPEVVSPGDAASYTYHSQHEKYPAQYDDAPKLTYDPNDPQYKGQAWPNPEAVSALSPNNNAMPWESLPPAGEANANDTQGGGVGDQEKRIWGIPRRKFIIIAVAVVLVVIIAVAVGGGVGASRAQKADKNDGDAAAAESGVSSIASSSPTGSGTTSPISTASQTSSPSASASGSSTSTSPSTTTSESLPTQTNDFLNNQTNIVGRAFVGFEKEEYEGRNTSIVRKQGFHDFSFGVTSYVWLPDDPDCCVTFCANKTTSVGWRCEQRFRPSTDGAPGFPRISIWCDRANWETYSKKCS